jgi:ADP-heptose:LPS heptosyltransferase
MDKKKVKLYINNIFSFTAFNILKVITSVYTNPIYKKKILLVNFGQIGDLTITSLFFDLRELQSNKETSILINEKYCDFFRYLAPQSDIIGINLRNYNRNFFYRLKILYELRKTYYDKILNLTSFNRIMTDEIVLLQNAGEYYCLKNNWNGLKPYFRKAMVNKYTEILGSEEINEYKRHFEVFKKFFNKDINSILLRQIEKLNVDKYFENYIVISPTTSQKISAWDINNFSELIRLLIVNFNVILLGDKLIKNFEDITSTKFLNFSGKTTIVEAVDIIRNCNLYLGNDSGLTHIALKFSVPIICILGGGAYNFYFPIFESENTKYIYKEIDCFNCDWYCKYQEPKCLTQISVEEVFDETIKMLKRVYV